ncbi:MAG: sensor histidine kinase, partial [Ornithinibacter sp.]
LTRSGQILGETRRAPNFGILVPRSARIGGLRVETRERPVPVKNVRGLLIRVKIQYARPVSDVEATVSRVRLFLAGGVLGGTLLALLGGLIVGRRAVAPVAALTGAARDIAETRDPGRSLPRSRADDEVAELGRTLQLMLDNLEASRTETEDALSRQRQFVADASHELRTPLATVRGYAELYRQGAVRDSAAVGSAMERIEAESTRMSGLVEDLLTLARIDDAPVVETAEVDLTVLAADAVADARVRAPERRISLLGLDGPVAPTPVRGIESQLRQVVTNLVANALLHTPEGTPVEVAVGLDDFGVALEVRDHGAGVPEEVATKVFERFYRADPSRGRAGGGGSGLGLAIVAAIVSQHHGRVGVAPTPGGGATFVVRLPQGTPSQ